MRGRPAMAHAMCTTRARQRGVAAIEFGIVFIALFTVLYGLATFGSVFYTRHQITRAAEDGARAVAMYNAPTEAQIQAVVRSSLAVPLSTATGLEISATAAADPVVVTVRLPYRSNAILPLLPLADRFIPDMLQARASAARPS